MNYVYAVVILFPLQVYAFGLLDVTPQDNAIVPGRWAELPLRMYLDSQGDLPLIPGREEDDLVRQAFQAWQDVPTSTFAFSLEGRGLPPYYQSHDFNTQDGRHYIIYDTDGSITERETGANRSDVLGFAAPLVNDATGTITGAIVVINGHVIETTNFLPTMIHEFGHLLGLDHSGITTSEPETVEGLPTMYPLYVTSAQATLEVDDKIAISMLYPDTATFGREYGVLSGRVENGRGEAVFGAHVVALDATTKEPLAATLTGFPLQVLGISTSARGEYLLPVPPGDYLLRIEAFPLEGYRFLIQDGAKDLSTGIGSNDFMQFDTGFATLYYDGSPEHAAPLTISAGETITGLQVSIADAQSPTTHEEDIPSEDPPSGSTTKPPGSTGTLSPPAQSVGSNPGAVVATPGASTGSAASTTTGGPGCGIPYGSSERAFQPRLMPLLCLGFLLALMGTLRATRKV